MFCDYHIHSTCSGDGLSSMQEQIQASLDKGVGKLCFTEHVDIGIVGDKFDTDLDLYARTFEEAKRAFPKLPLFMGLELGYVRKDVPGLQARCARLPLDFTCSPSTWSTASIPSTWIFFSTTRAGNRRPWNTCKPCWNPFRSIRITTRWRTSAMSLSLLATAFRPCAMRTRRN